MAHPNEDLIRRGYDAFARGDLDTLRGLFADDIVWHAGGNNPLSGDYRGQDEVFGFFGRIGQETGGTFRIDIHDVLGNDEHVVVLSTTSAERAGRSLSDNNVGVYHVTDGRVTEAWFHATDQAAVDAFWS